MAAQARLIERLASFTATLRASGFALGIGKTEDAARILASDLARRPSSLRPALRALCASNHAEFLQFDALFDAFFLGRHVRQAVRSAGNPPKPGPRTLRDIKAGRDAMNPATAEATAAPDTQADTQDDQQPGAAMQGGASVSEHLATRALADLADPSALAAAEAAALRIRACLRARKSRRWRTARHPGRLDLRRTIRASLARGGTPIDLHYRKPRLRPLRVALLIDVSGSMTLTTPLYMRFALGMLRGAAKTEAFLMHTSLVSVSAALRDPDRARALDRLTLLSKGAGGGTRLGESLARFNRHHAKYALAGRAACFILSDGFETGDIALLTREMAALQRRCRRLIWLNPLAAAPGYTPSARGMSAALPYLRLFAPAGSAAALAALPAKLARL